MKSNKFVLKIASIAVLTTSLISFNLTAVHGYSYYNNQYETVYRTGNTVTRSYGTSPITLNTTKTTASKPTNNTNTATNIINTPTSRTYNNYTSSGGKVTRYYGTNYSSNTHNIDSKEEKDYNSSSNNTTGSVDSTNITKDNPSNDLISSVEKMLSLINQERSKSGLDSLILDNDLTSVAQLKADDMVKSNYFSHFSPNYGSIDNMISSAGIKYYVAGENIAKAYSIESAHNNFMNSWSHKRAILAKAYTHVGIGIKKNTSGMYVISVMFINKK